MVGLSDVPCVGKIVDKLSDVAVAAMFRGLKYMFCYKSLVNDLNSKIEKLNNEKERMTLKVEEERDNGRIINSDVLKWQIDVEEIQKKDKDLSPSFRCIQCLPIPNPISLLKLGKQVVKKSKTVTALSAFGARLLDKDIAYLQQQSEDVPNTETAFEEFQSRKDAYGKLWEQLISKDNSLILGIYGMPGVGKTRMMKQIWKEAQSQENKVFNKVTLAVVGGVTFDVIKLQDQLASNLKCNFESKDDKKKRANQLKNSMKNSGKILIIFDDVWGEISLYDIIGTSFDDDNWKDCKILFTSREKSHCLNNKCKNPVEIKTLYDYEALHLFKKTLGTDQIDRLPDEYLVQRVCTKCAGLPLVIHAVGKALKFKTHNAWIDALKQLEDCKFENISGIHPEVYGCLKLSFDNLPEDAKQCLLLCSLLATNLIIDIWKFIELAAGSQLVQGGSIRVCAMIDTLESSSLLEGKEDKRIKLHDIIRDVARSIAEKEYAFLFKKCSLGLPGNSADYATGKVMHLELEKNDFHFPRDLVCPDLHTFWLRTEQWSCQIDIPKFPGGMFLNLRFLVLDSFSSQQQLYLQLLDKLKTLVIGGCNIVDTDISCFPESLETLCIWGCVLPTHLDFAKLRNLRKLEINGGHLSQVVPNTISSLSCLEKLCLQFPAWEDSTRTLMPKLNEISKLACLTDLVIYWSDIEPFQDTSIFRKLDRFDIRVGLLPKGYTPVSGDSTGRRIELWSKPQFEGFQNLVERADEVILRNTDVNIGRIWNRNRQAFEYLKYLYIEDCHTIEYLASISMYELLSLPRRLSSFSNLTSLVIRNCRAMKYLFNDWVAKCLLQLQELWIENCDGMEVIVLTESRSDGDLINFSKLKSLHLLFLSNLRSFYEEKREMQSNPTTVMDNSVIPSVQSRPLFDAMVAFPSLEELKISGLGGTVRDIWGKNYHSNDNVSSSFCKLLRIEVSDCPGLENVFQHPSMASHLTHLQKLSVMKCDLMKKMIGSGEQAEEIIDDSIIVFPGLRVLELAYLPNLISLWHHHNGEDNTYKVVFPNLVYLTLIDLNVNLEAIELGSDDFTCQLKYLNISSDKEIQLPSIWQLRLHNLEGLTMERCLSYVLKSPCFFKNLMALKVTELECCVLFSWSVLISLQQLQQLEILNCGLLEKIVENLRDGEASGMDTKTITLLHLRSVTLTDLPNLKSFVHGTYYELHMPALEVLYVKNCGLSTFFTCSVFKNLQRLKFLTAYNCKLLEGIVADGRGIETSDTNDKIITLSQLSSVDLYDLPNLKSFSLARSYAFNMPILENFRLYGCPLVENFTSLKTSTGLVNVYSEWHSGKEVPDLNDYIREYRRKCDSAKHQPLAVSFFFVPWSCPWAC